MKTNEIAALFVDLALKHDWGKVKELPDEEVQILFVTVSAAGFNPTKVIPGKLVGHYRDQDGSSMGETYPINGYCPYKVISRAGDDHYHATGWLDRAIRFARRGSDREERVKAIQHEVEVRSSSGVVANGFAERHTGTGREISRLFTFSFSFVISKRRF